MTRAVFLDALGTLVELEPPWVALREWIPAEVSDERLVAAVRVEMGYYREHAHEGRDADSLADLRERSARVLSRELELDVSADQPHAEEPRAAVNRPRWPAARRGL